MKKYPISFLILFIIFLSTFFIFPAFSKTIIVPGDASSIQDGINTADDFDTVLVSPGTYDENIILSGREVIVLSDSGALVTTLRPLDSNIASIKIDNAVTYRNPGKRNIQSQFSGFTITGSGNSHTVYIDGPTSVIISNNIFHDNIPSNVYDKAVIACFGDSSMPLITRNIFYDNNGITSVWIIEGNAQIINNTFDGNKSAFIGSSGMGVVLNNIVVNSTGTAVDGSFGKLDYNDVWNNTSNYG